MKLVMGILMSVMLVAACGDDGGDATLQNGESCMMDGECVSGTCVTEFENGQEVLGGLCTNECSFEDEDSCAEGEICLRYNPTNEFVCFPTCDTNEDCRADWSCACLDFFCVSKACAPPL